MQDETNPSFSTAMVIAGYDTFSQVLQDSRAEVSIVRKLKKIPLGKSVGRNQVGHVKFGKHTKAPTQRNRGP